MQSLTVLYDGTCRFCVKARNWLERQPQIVPLEFIPAGSPGAMRRFPGLDVGETMERLTVVSDEGGVYRGERAWVICLWALSDYREWSLKLSGPDLLPRAKRFVGWVSEHRHGLGRVG